MAGKVLVGLLAAVAVTGGAMMYGGSGGSCPLSGACQSRGPQSEVTSCAFETETDAPSCCAAVSRAKAVCCEDAEGIASGGDSIAALTGGMGLGR